MSKPEPSIFATSDPDEEERSMRAAEADVEAGRVVPHSEVIKWLMTWGSEESGPPPKEWGLESEPETSLVAP